MHKKLLLLLALAVATSGLTGCAPAEESAQSSTPKADTLSIVTTVFPAYDWTKAILGDTLADTNLTLLLDNGVDLHSYQPTADDIIKISECDLFVYVGGESDGWVEEVLANRTNADMVVINLVETLGDAAKAEELIEGMQESEHDHDHDHEEGENHDHEEGEVEYDEHVWLSVRNAALFSQEIAQKLSEVQSANQEIYAENVAAYCQSLTALDAGYTAVVDNATYDTLLFADRFPCRYLVEDYDLDYYAAFIGCSAETEASFETIKFLATKMDELNLPAVLTIEGSTGEIAQTVVESTTAKNQEILTLNSMQSVTATELDNGATYLSIMQANKDILEKALG